jgi:hypothetical protein
MTFDDLLADFDKLFVNATYMHTNHQKSCDVCITGAICEEMAQLDVFVENIEPNHFFFAEIDKCRCNK